MGKQMMKKKLVYIAHPYGGKESNKNKIDKIMNELVMNDSEHDHALKIGMPIFTLGDWKGCIK